MVDVKSGACWLMMRTSRLKPRTSRLMPRTSRLIPRTSRLMLRTSMLTFCFDIMVNVKLSAWWFILRTSKLVPITSWLTFYFDIMVDVKSNTCWFMFLESILIDVWPLYLGWCKSLSVLVHVGIEHLGLCLAVASWLMQVFELVGSC